MVTNGPSASNIMYVLRFRALSHSVLEDLDLFTFREGNAHSMMRPPSALHG